MLGSAHVGHRAATSNGHCDEGAGRRSGQGSGVCAEEQGGAALRRDRESDVASGDGARLALSGEAGAICGAWCRRCAR